MKFDDIDVLVCNIALRNASVKFGDPRYTCSINSGELSALLRVLSAMVPVAREASSSADLPKELKRRVAEMVTKLGGIK